jgi:hypothetical protein
VVGEEVTGKTERLSGTEAHKPTRGIMEAICKLGDIGYIEPGSHAHKFETIGCSEVADILGYGWNHERENTANRLWMEKTHRAPAGEHKRIYDRGHKMEPLGSEMIRNDYGRMLVAEQVQYRDPERPWLVYHADGMFPAWTPLNEDAKAHEGPGIWEFKAPGTEMAAKMRRDGMSQSYVCQGQMGMWVAEKALMRPVTWATFGFIDYNDWELVALDMAAIPKFQQDAMQLIERFHDCMVRDVPPTDINPQEAPEIPVISGDTKIITDQTMIALVEKWLRIKPILDEAKAEDEMLREAMKAELAEFAKAEVPGLCKFSYGYGKPGEKIDGEGLLVFCEHLCREFDKMFRRSDWVTPKPATRTFRPTAVKS